MTPAKRGSSPVTVVLADASRSTPSDRLEDLWLQAKREADPGRTWRTIFKDSWHVSAQWTRRARTFGGTTLGLMTVMTITLTIAILAAGLSMSQSTDRRQTALGHLVHTTEPMSANAQDLFTSLSLADTIAATGFVQAGVEQASTRDRYQRAIQRSSMAATQTAAALGTTPSRELELITIIQAKLPVYTGLVETARANNRLGKPVGVAYMSEASSLMRLNILPAARELLDLSNQKLTDQQRELSQPQWIPISGFAAAVVFLVVAQRWLAARTRRRLNKGFLTATVFMVVALLWVIATNGYTWYSGSKGYQEAAAPLGALTDARVLAQQARTSETLALVRRETSNASIEDFDLVISKVHREISHYEASSLEDRGSNKNQVETINDSLGQWEAQHSNFRRHLDLGEYERAIALSFAGNDSSSGGTTAEHFNAVDSGLARLMADARESLRSYLDSSLRATRWVSTLVLILSMASIAAIWAGIRPRLQEYL